MRGNLRALAGIVVLVIIALALAATRHHAAKPAVAAAPREWLQGTASCAFRAAGADVQVLATAQADCAQVQATLDAADALPWQAEPALTPAGADGQRDYETCSVASGTMRVTVTDSAGGGYGTGLCNDALRSGWETAPNTA